MRIAESTKSCVNCSRSVRIPPKAAIAVPFKLKRTPGDGRRIVTADITFNGQHLGEIAEAMIE